MSSQNPHRQIRALYDEELVTVYQAYNSAIAEAAVATQQLNACPDFKVTRMTWIKPSWAWMMYRSGYSYKDAGQARILALKMKHEHFIGLLEKGVLSSHTQKTTPGTGLGGACSRENSTEVRIQWDPERNLKLAMLPYRSIQIGVPGGLSEAWVNEWIERIEDVTEQAQRLKRVIDEQPDISDAELTELGLMPSERPFPVPQSVQEKLMMDEVH